MTTKIDPNYVQNLQTLEVEVSGPEGANRLFMISGIASIGLGAYTNGSQAIQKETFSILVGPTLDRKQFHRATINASLTSISQSPSAGGGWAVLSADADWDDESKQIEVRVEIQVSATSTNNVNVSAYASGFGFQVNILAEVEEHRD